METVQSSSESRVAEAASRVTPQIDQARQSLEELNTRLSSFIRQQPGACLMIAAGVGFVIGRIASR